VPDKRRQRLLARFASHVLGIEVENKGGIVDLSSLNLETSTFVEEESDPHNIAKSPEMSTALKLLAHAMYQQVPKSKGSHNAYRREAFLCELWPIKPGAVSTSRMQRQRSCLFNQASGIWHQQDLESRARSLRHSPTRSPSIEHRMNTSK
jgi:hypothetical protein